MNRVVECVDEYGTTSLDDEASFFADLFIDGLDVRRTVESLDG